MLASCSNDVTISENTVPAGSNAQKEIAFAPLSRTPKFASITNSGAIEGPTFPTGIDMMVTAWEQGAPGKDFFGATNFKYKYAGGTGSAAHSYWGGETPRYWPLSPCYINFLAIANANDDNATDVTWGDAGAAFASKVAVVMADNYAYNTKQHDFLYAIGHGEVTQTANALTFANNGIVDMTFKHAQAYLVFNVKAADAASQAIKIKNIEIYGARFAGTATINHTNYNAQAGQATTLHWDPTTQTNAYKSVLNDQTAKADAAASVALTADFAQMGKIIVVPNMSAADTYADNGTTKIKISYYLDSKLYEYEYEIDNDTYEAGKKYIYNITFKLHEIYINPTVTDWIVDLNNNSIVDDDVMIDIPEVSTAHGTDLAITANAAGRYTVKVTGLGASAAYTVAVTDGSGIITVDPVAGSADASGVATLKFNVKASAGTASANIVLTKTSDSSTTTITVNQD